MPPLENPEAFRYADGKIQKDLRYCSIQLGKWHVICR